MKRTRFIFGFSIILIFLLWPLNGSSEEQELVTQEDMRKGEMLFTGEASFENGGPPCIDCHNAGRSYLSSRINGPDLNNIRYDINKKNHLNNDWINSFKTHIKRPVYSDRDVTQEELNSIRAFLLKPEEELEGYKNGLELFIGRKAFKNGGPPCASCHSTSDMALFASSGPDHSASFSISSTESWSSALGPIRGGLIGPDLMLPNQQYGVGPAPHNPLIAAAWINSPGTPLMGPIYSNMIITDDEVGYLKEFFKSIEGKDNPSLNATTGQKLFTGELSFINDGTPCIYCHSAGNGMFQRGVTSLQILGPNLKDIYYSNKKSLLTKEWINMMEHINQPVYLNKNIAQDEIDAIKTYLKATDAELNEYIKGRRLFTGAIRLTNGGPACISCHNAGKWAYGVGQTIDLMLPNEKYGVGPAPLNPLIIAAWINSTGTRAMGPIYSRMNITDEEIKLLKTFFRTLPAE